MESRDAKVGEVIGGYLLIQHLASGSTSHVFLGEHVLLGRRAAIKILTLSVMDSPEMLERLLQEARAVNNARHPNIADIFDFIRMDSPPRVALIMEHVDGPSLKLLREHRIPPRHALALSRQLVDAVAAAHAADVIHRDLKPDNLLLTRDPREDAERIPVLKVVDFGLAKLSGPGAVQTAAGAMLGTPAYMAPEQVAGRPPPTAATDVFAVAELVYELFTGRRAYAPTGMHDVLKMKIRGEVPALQLPPPLDRSLLPTLLQALSARPEARPSLAEVGDVLLRLGADVDAAAPALAAMRDAPEVQEDLPERRRSTLQLPRRAPRTAPPSTEVGERRAKPAPPPTEVGERRAPPFTEVGERRGLRPAPPPTELGERAPRLAPPPSAVGERRAAKPAPPLTAVGDLERFRLEESAPEGAGVVTRDVRSRAVASPAPTAASEVPVVAPRVRPPPAETVESLPEPLSRAAVEVDEPGPAAVEVDEPDPATVAAMNAPTIEDPPPPASTVTMLRPSPSPPRRAFDIADQDTVLVTKEEVSKASPQGPDLISGLSTPGDDDTAEVSIPLSEVAPEPRSLEIAQPPKRRAPEPAITSRGAGLITVLKPKEVEEAIARAAALPEAEEKSAELAQTRSTRLPEAPARSPAVAIAVVLVIALALALAIALRP